MVVLIETTYDKVSSNWSTVSSKVEIMHGGGVVLNEEGYDTAFQVVPPRTKKLIVRLANLVFKKAVVVARDDTKKLLILQSVTILDFFVLGFAVTVNRIMVIFLDWALRVLNK